MSNYKFKGTPLSEILSQQSNSDFSAKYSGIVYTGGLSYSNYSMFRPLPVGYKINGVDISTTATAKYDSVSTGITYFSSARPSGANRVRYSLVGGGGGAGGGGALAWNQGSGSYSEGGKGGWSGSGGRVGGEINLNSYPNMSNTNSHIYIGPGGGGGAGANNYALTGKHSEAPIAGGSGSPGVAGTRSYIILRDSNNDELFMRSGGGGSNGGGGSGGLVPQYSYQPHWTHIGAGATGYPGGNGSSGPFPLSGYYPYSSSGGSGGNGGNITTYQGQPGTSGTAGSGVIVWLWD